MNKFNKNHLMLITALSFIGLTLEEISIEISPRQGNKRNLKSDEKVMNAVGLGRVLFTTEYLKEKKTGKSKMPQMLEKIINELKETII